MSTVDWVASAGAALLLLGFALNQLGRISEHSATYLWMNFIGAGVASCAAWLGGIIPFMVLEGVWALVAAWGLIRLAGKRKAVAT